VPNSRSTDFKIPIIDFSAFLSGSDASKQKTANEILDGFTSSGFIYLSNTSIPPETVSNVFRWSKKFFDLPQNEKLKLAWETPESNRGYVAPGREKVSRLLDEKEIDRIRRTAPDLKESMEIGKEPSDSYKVLIYFL
jgi:isopenicillin N synthase-like dioxygenase